MANMKYFSDFNGTTTEVLHMFPIDNAEFAQRFPGVKGRRSDGFSKYVGYRPNSTEILPITRSIEYKKNPSKHVCNSKCVNATGRIMKCECSCGGKNHGNGGFNCE